MNASPLAQLAVPAKLEGPFMLWAAVAVVVLTAAIVGITCRTTRGAARAMAACLAGVAALCVGLGSASAGVGIVVAFALAMAALMALGKRLLYREDVDPVAFRGIFVRAVAWGASWLTLLFAARLLRLHGFAPGEGPSTGPQPSVSGAALLVLVTWLVAALGARALVRAHSAAEEGR